MTFKIPSSNKKWTQSNESDLLGLVVQSKNVDFDKPGLLKLAKRARSIYDDSSDADFGNPTSIAYYNSGDLYFIVTQEKLFTLVGATLAVAEEATASVPTLGSESDLASWQGRMYVSGSTDLVYWNGSWNVADASASDGPMCVFKNKNSLALADDNTVDLYSTAHAVTITLTLPSEYAVTSMDWNNNFLYIGTRHKNNGEAMLFLWDGATTSANFGFGVGTHRIDSVVRYKSTVALVTSAGQLLEFIGNDFRALDNFPVYYTDYEWDTTGTGDNVSGRVVHRGMVVEDDLIFIRVSGLLNVSTDDDVAPNNLNSFPSGVWCYDPQVGLYHRYAQSGDLRLKTNAVTTANVNTTTDIITVAGVTVPATGTPVMYDDGADGVGTGIEADSVEIKFRQRYYTIYVSDTTFKLASTYALAIAGTAMNLTGTGNNSQYFIFLPNRDFGGVRNTDAGAITLFHKGTGAGAPATDARRILFGGAAAKTTLTTVPALCVAAEGQENRGYAITPKLFSENIKDSFQNVTISFRNVQTPEDKVLVKYRTVERYDFLKFNDTAHTKTGTWVDANTFTSTDVNLTDAKAGDEVEIGRGSGSGYLAHISSISVNAGTYTVNLDEDVQNVTAGDTMLYYVDNWQRLGQIENIITTSDCDIFTDENGLLRTGTSGTKTFQLDCRSRWIQLKIELRGEDVMIEDILINNQPLSSFIS